MPILATRGTTPDVLTEFCQYVTGATLTKPYHHFGRSVMPLTLCVHSSHVCVVPLYVNHTCGSLRLVVVDITMNTVSFLCALGLFAALQVPGTLAEDMEPFPVSR